MSERMSFVVAAIVVGVVLLSLHAVVSGDPGRRNWEIFQEMADSVAGESFHAAAALPGGVVLQTLQPGVVVRGAEPFYYGEGEEEAKRAGEELTSPFAPDDAVALARGGELFAIHCQTCHGADGGGQGPAVERGMIPPPPYNSATGLQMKDGQMFHVLTRGQRNMVSVASKLTPEDRWRVILHVRSLQDKP